MSSVQKKNVRNVAKQITSLSYGNRNLVGENVQKNQKNGLIVSKTPKRRKIQATKSTVSRFHSKIWKNKVSKTSIVSPSNRKSSQRWRSRVTPAFIFKSQRVTCTVIRKNDLPDKCRIAHSNRSSACSTDRKWKPLENVALIW